MTIKDITRIPLHKPSVEQVDDEMLSSLPDVRRQAAEELGYQSQRDAQLVSDDSDEDELLRALRECEIEILDWRAVEEYMLEKLHEEEQSDLIQRHARGERQNFDFGVRREWREVLLDKYEGFVPDYVLDKALSLKRVCPHVTFRVVELQRSTDPFLMASIGGNYSWERTDYFIEVWDEAAFARKKETT